jgi:diguanylate cyclase (GGDEF)-like protein/PAS domain S-box-containing protein
MTTTNSRAGNSLLGGLAESVLVSSPVPMVLLAPSGHIVRANQRFVETFGGGRSNPGGDFRDRLHLNERRPFDRLIETIAASPSNQPTLREARLVRPDGTVAWARMRASGVRADTGELEGIVLYLEDTTADHRSDAVVAAAEERFSTFVRYVSEAVLMLDAAGVILRASPATRTIIGHEPGELIGRNSFELVHPDDLERVASAFFEEVDQTYVGPETAEFRVLGSDGTYHDVAAIATNHLDDPAMASLVITVRDVHERRRALEELRASDERYRAIVEHSPDLIGRFDRALQFVYVNPAAAAMMRSAPSAAIGRRPDEIGFPAAIGRTWVTAIQQVFDTGEVTDLEVAVPVDAPSAPGAPAPPGGSAVVGGSDGSPTPVGRSDRRSVQWLWTRLAPELGADGTVEHVLAIGRDVTERREAEDRLERLAKRDALTGLPNRVLAHQHLLRSLARRARPGRITATLFCDFDRFKLVNDSLGHAAGDELLVLVADRLLAVARSSDTVARLGGDEFLVIVDDLPDEASAVAAAQRVLDAVSRPYQLRGREIVVRASVGVACSGEHAQTPEELLRDADAAMYEAKARGGNRLAVFSDATRLRVVERMAIEQDLHRALRDGELFLEYQPMIELRTGHVVGVEALVRWRHPDRGILLPGRFIPVAEETGLIVPIGETVLEQACAQAVRWDQLGSGHRPPTVWVNVSRRQLSQPELGSMVRSTLERFGLPADRLGLEVTETAFMDDPEDAVGELEALRGLGVRLAIDDFGTGYSSLSSLQQLPIDVLKIDRSFVDGLGRRPGADAIVEAVIALGHTLELSVLAEGVESAEQVEAVRSLGCDQASGYFVCRPTDPAGVERYVRGRGHDRRSR